MAIFFGLLEKKKTSWNRKNWQIITRLKGEMKNGSLFPGLSIIQEREYVGLIGNSSGYNGLCSKRNQKNQKTMKQPCSKNSYQ